MPRYYKNHARGYDLDVELPFCDVEGVGRCQLGSAGSFILICRRCFAERFRDQLVPSLESPCYSCGGPISALTFALAETLRPQMEAQGIRFTTIEYRRRKRLESEAQRPWDWVFGTQTEADFPHGYCKE